jgi:hypothetical protein
LLDAWPLCALQGDPAVASPQTGLTQTEASSGRLAIVTHAASHATVQQCASIAHTLPQQAPVRQPAVSCCTKQSPLSSRPHALPQRS